jgi:nicotinate-nucleotide pyrophosphorylase (carboxylating)
MKPSELPTKEIDFALIKPIIDYALREDIGSGDITTNSIIPIDLQTTATMTAKSTGIIAGITVAEYIFKILDPNCSLKVYIQDGQSAKNGEPILEIKGSYRALLTGERLALNFMQRMSGIATMTHNCVKELKGTKTQILDTRKTVPGLRLLDKYAVLMGGGTNHRIGLYDMVLLKDNHIKIAGGITKAIAQVKTDNPKNLKIEVETTTIEQVQEALLQGADIIMLDNMSTQMMTQCVKLIGNQAKIEASGNMTIERLKEVAETGVDYISIGALTHSVLAFDISMNIESE